MTLQELHYLMASMCVGLLFTSGLCTMLCNGWRNPYKWYVAILSYGALTFAVNVPFFDMHCEGLMCVVRDLFTIGLAPFVMLAVSKLTGMGRRLVAITQAVVWVGIVGTTMAFYSRVPVVVGYVSLGVMAFAMVLWCVSSRKSLLFLSVFVTVLALGVYAVRLALPFLHIEKLVLLIEAVAFLPVLLFQSQRVGKHSSMEISAKS